MKRILVASDLSDRSRPAVRRAVNLATATGAKLTVLHVVDESIPKSLSTQVQVGAKTMLAEQVAQDSAGRKHDIDIAVAVGDAISEIGERVATCGADLLILGLHRRRKFLDQIRETTMEHLIRSSAIPVLLVAGQSDRDYARVLAGVDLSDVCAAALHSIPMIAPDSALTLFHAHEVSFRKEAERDFEIWKAVHPLPDNLPYPVYFEGSAGDALHDIMKDKPHDLLIIGGHTRSNAGRYFLGSFTSGLIRNPPCDLLIAK